MSYNIQKTIIIGAINQNSITYKKLKTSIGNPKQLVKQYRDNSGSIFQISCGIKNKKYSGNIIKFNKALNGFQINKLMGKKFQRIKVIGCDMKMVN